MSFLRKWGSSSGPASGTNGGNGTSGSGGSAPGSSAALAEASKEWHNEMPGERYFGMENFGNTCYANSVLQSLYFSKPFRELVIHYEQDGKYVPSASSAAPPSLSHSYSMASSLSQPSSVPSATTPATSMAGSAALKQSSSRGAGGMSPSASRPSFWGGHKRQPSTPGPDSASLTESSSSGGFNGGAPLAQTSTQGSFTGVGTPAIVNGSLALERRAQDVNLLTTLHDLFSAISSQPKTLGTVAPQAFINQLKRENEFFRSTLHQDAHEFLNYLINMIAEALEKEEKERIAKGEPSAFGVGFHGSPKTWVHQLFEGILTNETRCLSCETVTSRDEAFLDLSIDIEQNSSVTACLRQFSASEMLCQRNKFSCDKCCGLQEAEKRMKIKKLPNILALHLKRFKYEESLQRHVKLTYRVVFPFELRLFNTADDANNPDRLYELWAIVVHIGAGPHHGHYITIVKSGERWIVFDDNNVYPIEQSEISKFFGDTPGQGSGYVLFYQAADLDLQSLGLRTRERTDSASTAAQSGPSASSAAPPSAPVSLAPQMSGLGLAMNAEDMAAARAPMSAAANASSPGPDPESSLGVPAADTQSSSSSNENKDANSPQKETSGWSLKGRKLSVGGRIGRSLSLASNSDDKREQARSVSMPMSSAVGTSAAETTPPVPLPAGSTATYANGRFSAEPDSIPVAAEATSRPESQISTPSAVTSVPQDPSSPAMNGTPPTNHSSGSSTPAHQGMPPPPVPVASGLAAYPRPPPSDDGTSSTVSTQNLGPNGAGLGHGAPPQRRGSRSSVDFSSSNSSVTSPNAGAAAGANAGGGALAATRNFLSRKPRPLSTVASASAVPTMSTQASPAVGSSPRPTTASGRLASAGTIGNGHAVAPPVSTQPPPNDDGLGGGPLRTSPSVQLTKKEIEKAEKRAKEERKLREKEERRRAEDAAKRQKEEERRLKEEAKKADKLRRKMSVK